MRETEAFALVGTECVELASNFVGVRRGRVHPLSEYESLLVPEAELGELAGVQGGWQQLHLGIVVYSYLEEC